MGLRCFIYENNEYDKNAKLLMLLSEINQKHLEGKLSPTVYEYLYEIFIAAIEGRIKLDEKFHIEAYVRKILETEKNVKQQKGKKCASCEECEELYEVGLSKLPNSMSITEEGYTEIEELDALNYNARKFLAIRDDILMKENVDLFELLRLSFKKNISTRALCDLKRLMKKYSGLSEILHDLLDSGYSFEDIFPDAGGFYLEGEWT